MKANYVLFQGGLGNQLYQLAYTDFLKRNGYSNVKLITPSNKNKGDTKDKSKRSLSTFTLFYKDYLSFRFIRAS